MRGKQKCKILKEIRQRIADENDIPFVTRECSFQGECTGTCPRCESELRYLEEELARRTALGKRVSVAALCVGIALTSAACTPQVKPDPESYTNQLAGEIDTYESSSVPEVVELSGEVAWPDDSGNTETPKDESPSDTSSVDVSTLTGDVAWPEPTSTSTAVNP